MGRCRNLLWSELPVRVHRGSTWSASSNRDFDFIADQSSFARKTRTLADHAAPLMTEAGLRWVVCCLHLHKEGTYGYPWNDTEPSRCIVRLTQHGYYRV
jgi:hypothetical protein